mmetsp:Transcript_43573/g.72403  ORF Transcript_43573/g.72403 Transcript_43573/m.72403 type:complete len:237 (+) Transcript_43573:577-1287(+)
MAPHIRSRTALPIRTNSFQMSMEARAGIAWSGHNRDNRGGTLFLQAAGDTRRRDLRRRREPGFQSSHVPSDLDQSSGLESFANLQEHCLCDLDLPSKQDSIHRSRRALHLSILAAPERVVFVGKGIIKDLFVTGYRFQPLGGKHCTGLGRFLSYHWTMLLLIYVACPCFISPFDRTKLASDFFRSRPTSRGLRHISKYPALSSSMVGQLGQDAPAHPNYASSDVQHNEQYSHRIMK